MNTNNSDLPASVAPSGSASFPPVRKMGPQTFNPGQSAQGNSTVNPTTVSAQTPAMDGNMLATSRPVENFFIDQAKHNQKKQEVPAIEEPAPENVKPVDEALRMPPPKPKKEKKRQQLVMHGSQAIQPVSSHSFQPIAQGARQPQGSQASLDRQMVKSNGTGQMVRQRQQAQLMPVLAPPVYNEAVSDLHFAQDRVTQSLLAREKEVTELHSKLADCTNRFNLVQEAHFGNCDALKLLNVKVEGFDETLEENRKCMAAEQQLLVKLENDISSLVLESVDAKRAEETLKDAVKESQACMQEELKRVKELFDSVEGVLQTGKQLKETVQHLQTKLKEMAEDLDTEAKEKTQLQVMFDKLANERDAAKSNYQTQLEQRDERLKDMQEECSNKLKQHQDEIVALKDKCETLRQDTERLESLSSQSQRTIVELEKKLQDVTAEHEKQVDKLKNDHDKQLAKVKQQNEAQAEATLKKHKNEIAEYGKTLEALHELQQTVEALQTKLAASEEALKDQRPNQNVQNENEKLKSINGKLVKDIEKYEKSQKEIANHYNGQLVEKDNAMKVLRQEKAHWEREFNKFKQLSEEQVQELLKYKKAAAEAHTEPSTEPAVGMASHKIVQSKKPTIPIRMHETRPQPSYSLDQDDVEDDDRMANLADMIEDMIEDDAHLVPLTSIASSQRESQKKKKTKKEPVDEPAIQPTPKQKNLKRKGETESGQKQNHLFRLHMVRLSVIRGPATNSDLTNATGHDSTKHFFDQTPSQASQSKRQKRYQKSYGQKNRSINRSQGRIVGGTPSRDMFDGFD